MNNFLGCVVLATMVPMTAMSSPATLAADAALAAQSGSGLRHIRTEGDLLGDYRGRDEDKAAAFFARHGRALGFSEHDRLRQRARKTGLPGSTTLVYEQTHRGVPVSGSWLKASLRRDGSLYAIAGDIVAELDLDTRPAVAAAVASARALAWTGALRPVAGLEATSPELVIQRLYARSNSAGVPVLAWRVEVTNARDVREIVFVDAKTGKVVDSYSAITDVLQRRVYHGSLSTLVWAEGDPTPFDPSPGGPHPIDNLIEYSADTYYFYKNLSADTFLSWDGGGAIMHAVFGDPTIGCPNASWNGVSINFCNGTTSDDVVAHEWAHAYTQSTHGLIYRWQSGALNESYSDIFGELVDWLNSAGGDAPAGARTPGVCSAYGGALPPTLEVLAPAALAGAYPAAGAEFNPPAASVSAALMLADDGSGSDACQSLADLGGAIALIDRGGCTFVEKVLNAQAAGASGVVIANNAGDDLVTMSGASTGITIPSVFIGQSDGAALRGADSATIKLADATENSLRWLMGEDAEAFGGALRDLWEPRCMGHPGKVGDAEYHCDATDNGGVHRNSGIPNHAFAMLVDGAEVDGETITAIGADKAAHIYWHAAIAYQGPSTDFAAHATALEAACADLSGLALPTLSTAPAGPGSTVVIRAADCAAVAAALRAVGMRDEPARCEFATLLAQDAPPLCPAGLAAHAVYAEDFEAGTGDWTAGRRAIANPATFSGADWVVVDELPDGRPGRAAYGADPVLGDCIADTEAGVIYLDSPAFTVPPDSAGLRLALTHNVATEPNYDGANIKISVNGAAFVLVPASAFSFNPYTGLLFASDNPLAGESAFHGADEGAVSSRWGESQLALDAFAAPGDTVRLRFELGTDGCNGLDGWYIDDVRAYSCELDSDADAVADRADNCTAIANTDQRDSDGDGYGNACDPDLNNSGQVEFGDLALLRAAFFSRPGSGNWNADADLDGDDRVDFADLTIMRALFFRPPGPSAIAP